MSKIKKLCLLDKYERLILVDNDGTDWWDEDVFRAAYSNWYSSIWRANNKKKNQIGWLLSFISLKL